MGNTLSCCSDPKVPTNDLLGRKFENPNRLNLNSIGQPLNAFQIAELDAYVLSNRLPSNNSRVTPSMEKDLHFPVMDHHYDDDLDDDDNDELNIKPCDKNLNYDAGLFQKEKQNQKSKNLKETKVNERNFYLNLINSSKIDDLFDDVTDNIRNSFDGGILIIDEEYSKDANGDPLAIKVFSKDVFLGEERHHEIIQKWRMDYRPEDYMFFNLFINKDIRNKIDSQIETFELMHILYKDGIVYYWTKIKTNKVLVLKGKETFTMCAFKELEDGNYMEVYKSWEHPDHPIKNDLPRVNIHKGGILFKKDINSNGKVMWDCTDYRFVDPQVSVGVKLLKPILNKYYKGLFIYGFRELDKFMNDTTQDDWKNYVQIMKDKFEP